MKHFTVFQKGRQQGVSFGGTMAQYIEQAKHAEDEMAVMLERLKADGHQVIGDEVIMKGTSNEPA